MFEKSVILIFKLFIKVYKLTVMIQYFSRCPESGPVKDIPNLK